MARRLGIIFMAVVLIMGVFGGIGLAQSPPPGKVLFFIYNDMADFEMTVAAYILEGDKEVVTIAYTKDPVKAKSGLMYKPHMTVKDALKLTNVDGIVITGGFNDEQRPELTQLIQKLNKEEKLVAAICAGPKFLARAGILDHKRYTTSLTPEDLKKSGGADPFPWGNFVDEKVVRDGNVITADGMSFVDFAVEVTDWFHLFKDAEQKAKYSRIFKGM